MKLVSYAGGFGRIDGQLVVPMGDDMATYLESGDCQDGEPLPFESLRLLAPIPRPGKIIGIGLNYRDHAKETGQALPDEPILFGKFANSVIGPSEAISIPPAANQVDYEAELAVVIGRPCHQVSTSEALLYVGGYTCANDVSARDLQFRNSQWMRAKAVDTFFPLGPWLVTPDEAGDPSPRRIRCILNGAVVQDSNTDQLIFGIADLVAFISQTITLLPGDIIATGTPPGVGMARNPPVFLNDGDFVTVDIEGIGVLTNPVRNERQASTRRQRAADSRRPTPV